MRYVPALDGLRGIAVLLVVLLHCHVPGMDGGRAGVEIFFVLSGYLITRILSEEYARTGAISLRDFYWRRARRLYPPLLLMLAVYLAVAPTIWPGNSHERDALVAAVYLSDYTQAIGHFPRYLLHTWSLSAEEKFYALWPLCLILLHRRQANVAKVLAITAAALFAWAAANMAMKWPTAYSFDTRAGAMVVGCWLAVMRWPEWLTPRLAGGVGALLLVVYLAGSPLPGMARAVPYGAICGALLVCWGMRSTFAPAWLVWTGKLSYGIYLWHYPIARAIRAAWYVELPIVLALSFGLAALSYWTVEKWIRAPRRQKEAYSR